jgi:hypothetical protein
MQRQLIGMAFLVVVLILAMTGRNLDAVGASPVDYSVRGLYPVALFDFRNAENMGEDSVSISRKGAPVGIVTRVDSPFGCAAEFDGKGRISVDQDHAIDFTRAFSATAWVNGTGSKFHMLEHADRRGPNFQVVGDKIYFVTNSDGPLRSNVDPNKAKKGPLHYPSIIWSGSTDANLGEWSDKQRTMPPLSGLEPKLQVVGRRLFFEYFGGDAEGNWQIYTGTSDINGDEWLVRQRTSGKRGYAAEQSRNIQIVGNQAYYAFPLKDKKGQWQLWTATSNVDGTSWKAVQQTRHTGSVMLKGFIPSFRVSGDKIYYIYVSVATKNADVVIASSNLDGSNWNEIRRIHGAAPWLIARLTVDKGVIYYAFTKQDPSGDAHLWTGKMLKDGSSPEERQRTFGKSNASPSGIQVVGDKVMYSFSWSKRPAALERMMSFELMGMSFFTASTDLDGDHWVQHRQIGDDDNDYVVGYKMLQVVGGKAYYDLIRLHYVKDEGHTVAGYNGILAYSGSNILSKGDSYGIGMSASESVSGFVNAGEDYLYRGEAPEDTAGAIVEQKLAPGWHHVAVTYDDDILRLYVDGKLARETRYNRKPAANPFPLSIGDGFVGKIAHVMLFDRALNKSEVSTLAERHQTSCRPVVASL